jgi:3-oxoacyl-(acyl-carrier-protein) synthase
MLVALVDAVSKTRAGEVLAQGGGVVVASTEESELARAMASMQRAP